MLLIMVSNGVKILTLLFLDTVLCVNEFHRREEKKFEILCLGLQNMYRAFYGAPPLIWDDTLAESSEAWAIHLNSIHEMKHSTSRYGENLFASDNPENIDFICEYAMRAWFNERKVYDFNDPKFSEETGHFTQMVWKSSKRIGIGDAGSATGKFYIVARYYPPGNMDAGYEDNVLPKRKMNINCITKFASKTDLKELAKAFRITKTKLFDLFYNTSEPCNMNLSAVEPTSTGKQSTGKQSTGKQEANQGAKTGQTRNEGKPATVLVAVPIAEPAGSFPQQPILSPAAPSFVVPPEVPPVVVISPVQPITSIAPSASSQTTSTVSAVSSVEQTVMNPARATNGQ